MKKDVTCYCCGEEGHHSKDCPKKDTILKDKWAIKKGMPLLNRFKKGKKEKVQQTD